MDRLSRRPGFTGDFRRDARHLQLPGSQTVHEEHGEGENAQVYDYGVRERRRRGEECAQQKHERQQIDELATAYVGSDARFGLRRSRFVSFQSELNVLEIVLIVVHYVPTV